MGHVFLLDSEVLLNFNTTYETRNLNFLSICNLHTAHQKVALRMAEKQTYPPERDTPLRAFLWAPQALRLSARSDKLATKPKTPQAVSVTFGYHSKVPTGKN